VISTRSKHGTTWMQMICGLLIFGVPELPAPLGELSPWLDWLVRPIDEVRAQLQAQSHRRFIKTHTPLDGIPVDPLASYIVVARHPLDAAVSLYHQGNNINRERLRKLTGQPEPTAPSPPKPALREWLLRWIESDDRPQDELDSLPGVMWHLSDAWARRTQPNVRLVHYDDLLADLGGQMRGIAGYLGIAVPEAAWPALVRSATFEQMRATAVRRVPDRAGVLKDPGVFFRRGSSGAGREVLTTAELAAYHARAVRLASAELLGWLHRDQSH
jgi:aryl sulfotransferase